MLNQALNQWKNSNFNLSLSINISTIASSFFATQRLERVSKHQQQQRFNLQLLILIIMQSTLDIKLSNVRSRNQTIKQIKTRKNLNKQHEFAQLETQNQLNTKHDLIRFKFIIFRNRLRSRFSSMQKVEIFISKQFILRHHLSQYIVNEKYVKNSNFYMNFDFKSQKFFDSALRFIYDVFKFDNISIFNQHQHLYTTYWNQIEQWNEKKRFLKTLFTAEFESWLKITSKITWIKRFIMNDIETHITNILKSIVVQNFIIWIRHIDNVKL